MKPSPTPVRFESETLLLSIAGRPDFRPIPPGASRKGENETIHQG